MDESSPLKLIGSGEYGEWDRARSASGSDDQGAQLAEAFLLGRIGEPDDIALAALFLISDTSP